MCSNDDDLTKFLIIIMKNKFAWIKFVNITKILYLKLTLTKNLKIIIIMQITKIWYNYCRDNYIILLKILVFKGYFNDNKIFF